MARGLPTTAKCPQCSARLTRHGYPGLRGDPARYCSPACRRIPGLTGVTKTCTVCLEAKDASLFQVHRGKNRNGQLTAACSQCKSRKAAKRQATTGSRNLNTYRSRAKQDGVPFDLTLDKFRDLTSPPCFYCALSTRKRGLDKVVPALGYVASNVVACCFTCNRAKMHMQQEAFLRHVAQIAACHPRLPKAYEHPAHLHPWRGS